MLFRNKGRYVTTQGQLQINGTILSLVDATSFIGLKIDEKVNWEKHINDGGAVVYWIEPLTLDQRVPGSIPVNTMPGTFCPSARHFIHIAALHPGV